MEKTSKPFLFLSWILNIFRIGMKRGCKEILLNPVHYRWYRDIPFFNYSKIESLKSLNRRFSLLTQEFKDILAKPFSDNFYSNHAILAICKHLAAHKLYRCDYFITYNKILLEQSLVLDRSHNISVVSSEEFSFLSDVIFEPF